MARPAKIPDQTFVNALVDAKGNKQRASDLLGVPCSTLKSRLLKIQREGKIPIPQSVSDNVTPVEEKSQTSTFSVDKSDNKIQIIVDSHPRINSVDDAILKAGVDMDVWEVERVLVNGWDVTMKINDKPTTTQNQQIKIWLRRKVPKTIEDPIKAILSRLESKSPVVKLIKRKVTKGQEKHGRNALELCIMDPHYGMRCFTPSSDAEWSPELCESMVVKTLEGLLNLSAPYAPFDEIILPFGNDFFHTDNVFNTTTGGTVQPEGESYLHTFTSGEEFAISIIEMLKEIAPVKIYSIPGNHDRTSSFMLGRILQAYYHNDKNVSVDASSSPYKFHRYGVNLIGYEHGHSVKPQVRLASLMANECPKDWEQTKYREFHIGDQHRKGSSRPSVLEEQGVSIEYLPSITAPNEWHRLKSYNHQKRGTMAFVWNYDRGPIARLQVNIDKETNWLMGEK